ncbi:MAG: cytochrome C biogenesis protein [Candidatus Hydrogenedentes bacterium]|nr:cytochrome C biogenesis protein [Candidatus Hydrogenedentota bacterium]
MPQLFESLSHAVQGAPLVAIAAAFAWGVLSIVLSPCHLASVPLIVGFIDEQGRISTRRAFCISLLFATGILVTIATVGAVTAAMGRMLGDIGRFGNYLVALIFFVVGLHLMEVISLPLPGVTNVGAKRKGLFAAFLLGLVFGLALGPCTFAYMAPIVAVTFALATSNFAYGLVLLLLYAAGHCLVIVIAGTSAELVQRYLDWNEHAKAALLLKKACGLLVLIGGVYLVYTAP